MINYCIETFIYQALFIGLYQLLKSEPLFKINRLYLLVSLAISLVLPVISFGNFNPIVINDTYVQWLQPININTQDADNTEALLSNLSDTRSFSWSYFSLFYGLGLIFYSLWFIIKNRAIFKHFKRSSQFTYKGKQVAILSNSEIAFSFWNRIYLGEDIPESQRKVILEHEYQHLRLKHTWDLMALEILQFMLWFNPLIYIYKRHLRQIHEFEADRLATQNTSKSSYVNTLLNQSFGSQNISFVNSFYQSSNLKNRIKMLHKSKFNRLKYLSILPVLALAFIISCTNENDIRQNKDTTDIEQLPDYDSKIKELISEKMEKREILLDKIKQKPDIKTLFEAYGLELKHNYNEEEQRKVYFIMTALTLSPEYDNDESYRKSILKDIAEYKTLYSLAFKHDEDINTNSNTGNNLAYPFAKLDQVPHPSSCNGITGEDLKQCVSQFISTHVNTNFNTGLASKLGLTGTNRVSVQFKIDQSGHIVDVRARGPHPKLEQEAQRVIKSLPQMIPGQVDGENVSVLYGLPINFVIQE